MVKPPSATPMMKQYQALKQAYPDCILFFRMGDFYEMFGADAEEAAPILGIALTSRDRGREDAVPMCGVPHHSVEPYIAKLIQAGRKVAIGEQMEDPRFAKGIVKREVTRVITPGTVLDDGLLDARENSYLAAALPAADRIGLAALDLSTGEFRATEFREPGAAEQLRGELDRMGPQELLLPAAESPGDPPGEPPLLSALPRGILRTETAAWTFRTDSASEALRQHYDVAGLSGLGLEDMEAAVGAAGALLVYVRDTQMTDPSHLRRIHVYRSEDFMVLDETTRRNLELTRTLLTGRREGTLLDLLDRTTTAMGARLLKSWLLRPLIRLEPIRERHQAVEILSRSREERRTLREALRKVYDLERLLSRICLGAAGPRDMDALRRSLHRLPDIMDLLGSLGSDLLDRLRGAGDDLEDLRDLLDRALVSSPPATLREGNLIRDGYSAELDELRGLSRDAKTHIARIEGAERESTGIQSLKVRFNKVFGYFIEVTRANLDLVPEHYVRKQTLANAERYITPQLKELESRVLGAEERIVALEQDLFQELRLHVAGHADRIQRIATLLAHADVLASLAENAVQQTYVRPEMDEGEGILIHAGRHPVVERISEREVFVPNDTEILRQESQIHLITGPNMAGKSTYIRQVALIVLMAQMGSFVPADAARIGMVDRIFTRVGASDHLYGGLSTFMVEMTETANILNSATDRSLIILDEIGRGTSTYDGLSIAWAVVEYLHENPEVAARTLFATHYHELTELEQVLPRVRNYAVLVREWNDQVVFLRKVAPGSADRSYGIQVGRLAGLPEAVVERAKELLANLEGAERDAVGRPILARQRGDQVPSAGPMQLGLFTPAPLPPRLTDMLRSMDVDRMTPLEGLNRLAQLKQELESEE